MGEDPDDGEESELSKEQQEQQQQFLNNRAHPHSRRRSVDRNFRPGGPAKNPTLE
jgi:hypothetical protein